MSADVFEETPHKFATESDRQLREHTELNWHGSDNATDQAKQPVAIFSSESMTRSRKRNECKWHLTCHSTGIANDNAVTHW
mmetsp:Transcript_109348/g.265780  ORF Transcript_109348/g.265780 Transcript_109348/m.265780 type:complete len:81 (-) Transcript_109348:1088-1330(-)